MPFPFSTAKTLSSATLAKRARAKRAESKAQDKAVTAPKKKKSPLKKAIKAISKGRSTNVGGQSLFQNVRSLVRAFSKDDDEE